jgi:ribosomal protein L29
MKNKALLEIKNKDISELRKAVHEAKGELLKLGLEHSQFKLKNTKSLTIKRKEIAVMQTIIKEKEMHNEKNA